MRNSTQPVMFFSRFPILNLFFFLLSISINISHVVFIRIVYKNLNKMNTRMIIPSKKTLFSGLINLQIIGVFQCFIINSTRYILQVFFLKQKLNIYFPPEVTSLRLGDKENAYSFYFASVLTSLHILLKQRHL